VIGVDDDFGKVDDDEVGLWGWFGEVEMKRWRFLVIKV